MEEKNKKIFLVILWATIFVVTLVWLATAPKSPALPSQSTSTAMKVAPAKPAKAAASAKPKAPAVPSSINNDMGIPALELEKPISTLSMPDIVPPAPKAPHVDPRIAATVLTSGDSFDRLVNGAVSLFVYVFTH